jgi:signal transduction histidine kinase
MRLLKPTSLRGWVILIVLSTLAVSQLVMFLSLLSERGSTAASVYRTEMFGRIQAVVAQLEQADAASYQAIVDVAQSATFDLSVDDSPIVTAEQADRWAGGYLSRILGEDNGHEVRVYSFVNSGNGELAIPPEGTRRVAVGPPPNGEGDEFFFVAAAPPDSPRSLALITTRVSVGLTNGDWLNVTAMPLQSVSPVSRIMIGAAAAGVLVILLAVWGANRVARPLRALSAAAPRIGREEDFKPLPETGPADVRRMISAFNDMATRVRRTLSDQRTLLRSVGHDLRSPLTSIRIRLEFVKDEKLKQQLIESVDEIDKLTADAIEIARGDSAGEPVRRVDLAGLASSVCAEQAEQGRVVPCAADDAVWVNGRASELRRAIRNLVENAVLHGGASVRMERNEGHAVVSVEDTGPGIPEHELTRVLEPFAQLDTARTRYGRGNGLGLAIVRAIAERHGGSLTLSNRSEAGLQAVLRIPLSGTRSVAAQTLQEAES